MDPSKFVQLNLVKQIWQFKKGLCTFSRELFPAWRSKIVKLNNFPPVFILFLFSLPERKLHGPDFICRCIRRKVLKLLTIFESTINLSSQYKIKIFTVQQRPFSLFYTQSSSVDERMTWKYVLKTDWLASKYLMKWARLAGDWDRAST